MPKLVEDGILINPPCQSLHSLDIQVLKFHASQLTVNFAVKFLSYGQFIWINLGFLP